MKVHSGSNNMRKDKGVLASLGSFFPAAVATLIVLPCLGWQIFWIKQGMLEQFDVFPSQDTLITALPSRSLLRFDDNTQIRAEEPPKEPTTLLNMDLIKSTLLKEAPWAESHGANHDTFLGGALLYYAYAYAFQSSTIVVLGSGGGFVPRVLKQAQRDLEASGRPGPFHLYLVDAHLPQAGWGSTFYADNMDTIMRKNYNDIHYIFNLTDDGYNILKDRGVKIDYLHVDADHGFEQSWKDFDNYSKLLSERAVVSIHDTCRDTNRSCHVTGVAQTVDKVRSEMDERGLQLMDAHYLYRGLAFAIRREAPALETPSDRRINFCRNNAETLDKVSPGFTLNGDVGKLPTLGSFFKCDEAFNMTDLTERHVCPYGTRRHPLKGNCKYSIPGMRGSNCETFTHADVRHMALGALFTRTMEQKNIASAQLAAGWLATEAIRKQRAKHIFELGPSASLNPASTKSSEKLAEVYKREEMLVASNLIHDVRDILVVDPLIINDPVWIDAKDTKQDQTNGVQIDRKMYLPCNMRDVLSTYRSELPLKTMDTFVCLACNDLFIMLNKTQEKNEVIPPFSEYLHNIFPDLQTIVLGINEDGNDVVTQALDSLLIDFAEKNRWTINSNVEMVEGDGKSTAAVKRRLLYLSRDFSDM
ncbi:MAG: hypothetical protein SGILL_008303 [Bacillariaceae sp.]